MDTWRGELDDSELDSLKEERQYIIFVPNPDDETNFTITVVDTVSSHGKVIKGIMHMLDTELEYLVEKGDDFILKEYEETLNKSDNLLMFDPRKTKH